MAFPLAAPDPPRFGARTIVPSGPGYVGTFELTAVSICALFGIERDPAFAMALLVHVMILGVTSVGGIVAYVALRGRVAPTSVELGQDAAANRTTIGASPG